MERLLSRLTRALGTAWAVYVSILLILVWLVTGPLFGFSDTWQLVINTTTTIITFIMVFVIQNTTNRSDVAMHAKLDDLIEAFEATHNPLVRSEELSEHEIEQLRAEYHSGS